MGFFLEEKGFLSGIFLAGKGFVEVLHSRLDLNTGPIRRGGENIES